VTLEIELPHGVKARLLNSFESSREGKRITVRLDDMIAGEVRTVVFKLTISEEAGRESKVGGTLPVEVALGYHDVESGDTRTTKSREASLTFASERECAAESPSSEVLEDAALVEAAIAREEALRYDAAGDYTRSAAHLTQTAQQLRAMAPASPAVAAEAQMLAEESNVAQGGMTQMQRKAMHYTRSTRLQGRRK
jgi:hypothetical protein